MKPFRILEMGLLALWAKPFRTGLAALGIVIGVGSVVALTSLGNGVQNSVSRQITDLGPNLITVSPGGSSGDGEPGGGPFGGAVVTSTLTPQDTENVAGLSSVKAASSSVSTSGLVEGKSVQLSGVDPSYETISAVDLASVRFVEDRGEAVLSETDAKTFLGASPQEALGKTITISGAGLTDAGTATDTAGGNAAAVQTQPGAKTAGGDVPEKLPAGVSQDAAQNAGQGELAANPAPQPGKKYEVVGVASSRPSGIGPAQSAISYIPTRDALDLSGSETVGQILVSAKNADSVSAAKAGISSEISRPTADRKTSRSSPRRSSSPPSPRRPTRSTSSSPA